MDELLVYLEELATQVSANNAAASEVTVQTKAQFAIVQEIFNKVKSIKAGDTPEGATPQPES